MTDVLYKWFHFHRVQYTKIPLSLSSFWAPDVYAREPIELFSIEYCRKRLSLYSIIGLLEKKVYGESEKAWLAWSPNVLITAGATVFWVAKAPTISFPFQRQYSSFRSCNEASDTADVNFIIGKSACEIYFATSQKVF